MVKPFDGNLLTPDQNLRCIFISGFQIKGAARIHSENTGSTQLKSDPTGKFLGRSSINQKIFPMVDRWKNTGYGRGCQYGCVQFSLVENNIFPGNQVRCHHIQWNLHIFEIFLFSQQFSNESGQRFGFYHGGIKKALSEIKRFPETA